MVQPCRVYVSSTRPVWECRKEHSTEPASNHDAGIAQKNGCVQRWSFHGSDNRDDQSLEHGAVQHNRHNGELADVWKNYLRGADENRSNSSAVQLLKEPYEQRY